ncbi:MAG: hypothetical protein HY554_16415 [Elusimicrobia bacterium]|nr:hypothetical protein [Elusimicrobiota bacterium]
MIGSVLVACALGAGPARAQPAAVGLAAPPESAPALDRLFDGALEREALRAAPPVAAGADRGRILYAEADPPPLAPRYALNLPAVPAHFRRAIPGFERLFHKNQEETPEQVKRVNALIARRNRGRLFGKLPEWTYDGRPNEPVWTCLSHAAATANDWWSLQLGKPLPVHTSLSHGGVEVGLDPYLLELEYFRRGGRPDFAVPPTRVERDPVRNTGFPYEPRGYARLLAEAEPYEVEDPLTGEKRAFRPEMSSMEGEWLELFTNSVLRERTPARHAKTLADGIDRWGIAMVQLEHTDRPRLPGAHTVAVVGYFCMEPGERLIDCAANRTGEDWGRTAHFIAHDSYGDYPAWLPRTATTASAYRAVRIESIDQAIVFPHGLRVTLTPRRGAPGVWDIGVANRGGRPVEVAALQASGAGKDRPVLTDAGGARYLEGRAGERLRLYVEAPHYHSRDGRGRAFAAVLDAEAPRLAAPASRY